mmetsp:Transcript_15238/g.31338  ORF Transcript_15238/g.31338 Transcript_15238/m.31338 type:complete len:205 (-) Transcript_15238:597-1211(-)
MPKIRLALKCACLETSSSATPFTPATTSRTCRIIQGSLLPFTPSPITNLSGFFLHGSTVRTNGNPACVGLISHQGASVSSSSRSRGRALTTSRFSSVRSEQPLRPTKRSRASKLSSSASDPSKECTTPSLKRCLCCFRKELISGSQLRECRKRGFPEDSARHSCASNPTLCSRFPANWSRSKSNPSSPTATTHGAATSASSAVT